MNEPRKPGRPKRHLEESHHFHAASDAKLVIDDVTEETLIAEIEEIVENPALVMPVAYIESPVEEKIQELVAESLVNLNGWQSLDAEVAVQIAPRNGMAVRLSETPDGDGVLGFWRRTRAFNGKRYAETGKWIDFHTGTDISFQPKYWKERF